MSDKVGSPFLTSRIVLVTSISYITENLGSACGYVPTGAHPLPRTSPRLLAIQIKFCGH
nr:MAG TPA: hypothetical protein [Caudoviricetes sp.]